MAVDNLFRNLCFNSQGEQMDRLFASGKVRVERIASSGQTSGIYDQEEDEWLVLLQGRAELLLVESGERLILERGDHLHIAAGCRHRVTYTSDDCLWLCVFWTE